MAIDTLARGLAASNSGGGGGGSLDVGIEEGVGIKITGTDPKTISNDGVTNITASDSSANDGTIKVVFGNKEGEAASRHIAVKGLSDGAFMQKETSIPATASATDTKFPTSKAVASALDGKIDNSKKGVANGVATLDANAKLTSSQLPSHNQASNTINAMTGYTKPGTTSAIDASTDTLNSAIGKLEKALDGKQATGTYATGDSSGNAVTANKLANTSAIGSVTKGVYFKADGTPATMTYEVNATVPSDAKFTDTTYTADLNTGVTVNNTTFKISNTGVRGFIDSKDSDGNGTFRANVGGTEKVIGIKGLSDAAYKGVQTTMTSTSTDLPTSKAVATYISTEIGKLPTPMQFKGTLGTGGTITSLPDASSSNTGYTYKVITAGTYASQTAKVGDIFISNGSSWVYIPSADDEYTGNNLLMTSYSKGSKPSSTAVTSTDTANNAVSKIEWALDDKVAKTTTVNGKALSGNVTLAGSDVKVTGYTKATADSSVVVTDTVNSAIGKVEYKADKNKSDISTIKTYINNGGSEAKNGTTCTINVPENVSDFASIAMVGGKTEKSRNILKNGAESGTRDTVTYTVNNDGSVTLNATTATTATTSITLSTQVFEEGTYTLMLGSDTDMSVGGYSVKMLMADGSTSYTEEVKSSVSSVTITGGIAKVYIRISSGRTFNNHTIYPMLVRGTTTDRTYNVYHEDLWNAPVEKIVSNGKNLFNAEEFCKDSTNKTYYNYKGNGGVEIKSTDSRNANQYTYSTFLSAGTYVCSGMSSVRLYNKTTSTEITTASFTLAADSEITLKLLGTGVVYPQIEKSSTATSFAPYFETELSLTEIVKNLPDYGIGISADCMNYVDFESGKYYRNCKMIDMSSVIWGSNSGYYYSTLSDKAKGASNIVPEKYSIADESTGATDLPDKSMRGNASSSNLFVKDSSGTPTGLLVYELATPEVIDLADTLYPIPCESGGTITFVNEHSLDVPNKVIYKKEV